MKKSKTIVILMLAFSSISFNLEAQINQVENLSLSPKQQSLVAIAALAATGNLTKLKTELNKGLEAGLTVNQIKEALVHIYAYAGFPRSIRGLQKTGYAAFAPVIEIFLKEHLFADIFERDVLTYTERELLTISVLSSLGGVEPMLRSHLNICLNVGLSSNQLQQFTAVIKSTIGRKQSKAAQKVLMEVLSSRN